MEWCGGIRNFPRRIHSFGDAMSVAQGCGIVVGGLIRSYIGLHTFLQNVPLVR